MTNEQRLKKLFHSSDGKRVIVALEEVIEAVERDKMPRNSTKRSTAARLLGFELSHIRNNLDRGGYSIERVVEGEGISYYMFQTKLKPRGLYGKTEQS